MANQDRPIEPGEFKTFGSLLEFLRRRAGLTQTELALAVGYGPAQISRLERHRRAPDWATVASRFVPALGLDEDPAFAARLLVLAAPPAPQRNLPLQPTPFLGRAAELAQLAAHLATHRLVTLTGAGGVGKTRLALEAAAQIKDPPRDGIWWVELAALTDPALVAQTAAAVLGVRAEPGTLYISQLKRHLQAQEILLILDNCEHLVDACAQLVNGLLQSAPGVRFLATSREALALPGELIYQVPLLSLPDPHRLPPLEALAQSDAVRLFTDRARAVFPEFRLTLDNAPAVVRACQRLDGIPLAIELATAWMNVLQLEQLVERLSDRFRLLTSGSRAALPRHQTLRALIDWSYDRLTPLEQTLLDRLSVFAGGWTLAAAEQVAASERSGVAEAASDRVEVLALLHRLAGKSLVLVERQPGGHIHYRLLDTIRAYAAAKLAANDELAKSTRERHARYCLGLVEEDNSVSRAVWFERIAQAQDNIRAALTWCRQAERGAEVGLRLADQYGRFCFVRGYWTEAQAWLEDTLAHPGAGQFPLAQAGALHRLGDMASLLGNYAVAEARLTESLTVYQRLDDRTGIAWALTRLGRLFREQDDAARARDYLEQALQHYRALDDSGGIAWSSVTLAQVLLMQGDSTAATAYAADSLARFEALEEAFGMGWAVNHLGHAAQLTGDIPEAIRLQEASLGQFGLLGDANMGLAWVQQSLGECALMQADAPRARLHFATGLELFRDFGDRAGVAWCMAGAAGAAAVAEDPATAVWLWGAAAGLRHALGSREAPASHATHLRLQAAARAALGEAEFAKLWEAGQAAPTAQAIERALESCLGA